jgi:hypothetical protein
MVPTYGGAAIFGFAPVVVIQDSEPARQENAYPGIDGVESLHMGTRGRFAVVTGVLTAASPADLTVNENVFRLLKDGIPRPLMDTSGYTWYWAVVQSFDPEGARKVDGKWGYHRPYRAVFRLLT